MRASRAAASGSIRAQRSGQNGRRSWARSGEPFRLEDHRADVAAHDRWMIEAIERTVEPRDADIKTERRAAGERCDAWPGRREFPIEQDRWPAPERYLLPRQRACQPLH